ncbi:MAG: 16S rRNA (guanine(527)-N(7))-methyltransferase RsmG [Planctomycetota bacterium]|mgnify:CR=1 FL=1|nr:MAG: 16S rRNA (guanine(527)-N(7))-methyltransferase RsmG [Planctomycetota bacterium]
MAESRPSKGERPDPVARESELLRWLAFDPEPDPIPCDADARALLTKLGIELEAAEEVLLSRYLGMLFFANERFNLTRIDKESAWTRHVVDSLTLLAPMASMETLTRAIDVGSGGGLPGIPLAIARPEIAWTLLEATAKKARFLEAVAHRLKLTNITVVNDRAEKVARTQLRESFDVATSRAVGGLADLAMLSIPLIRIGGMMLAIKGERAGEEIAASKQPLYELHASVVGEIKSETNTIIAIEKTRKTPTKFP